MKWQRSAARLLVVVVVLMTVTGAFAPAVAATADGPPQPPQRYFGTVTDGGGSPVGGVLVEVTQDGEVVATDVTDSDGYYDLTVNTSTVNTDEQVEISVKQQTKSADVASGGSTEVDFSVDAGDTVAGGSAALGDDGSAAVPLSGGDLSEVAVDLGSGASGTLVVRESTTPTGSAPAVSSASVVTYLDVSVSGASGGGTVTVTVSESALADAGVAPADANVLHYEDGAWQTLDTTLVGETNGDVTLRADVSGFSPFAIAGSSDSGGDTGDGDTETPGTTQANTGGGGGGGGGGGTGGGGSGESETTTPPTTDSPTTSPPTSTPTTDSPTSTDDGTTPSETTSDPGTSTSPPGDGEDGGPGLLFVGGLVVVLLAVAGALYMVYGRE
ncbi:PGF-pre-PGF domain-containing protein [Halobacterium zhouii]|uniref:PGF-pre-PGF domain-containing protein n=1 Tax=Halobacterium zhouii TaxID=2902624 RepID=UPI001E2A3406|nr:PGF-pre-PGF domain-containing protein [Halobacterium zhouii]